MAEPSWTNANSSRRSLSPSGRGLKATLAFCIVAATGVLYPSPCQATPAFHRRDERSPTSGGPSRLDMMRFALERTARVPRRRLFRVGEARDFEGAAPGRETSLPHDGAGTDDAVTSQETVERRIGRRYDVGSSARHRLIGAGIPTSVTYHRRLRDGRNATADDGDRILASDENGNLTLGMWRERMRYVPFNSILYSLNPETVTTTTTLRLLRAHLVAGCYPISVALSLTPANAASSLARG